MTIIQAMILGLVQGLTEFIPVSSSGHLVLTHYLLGTDHASLTFDLALHLGTLAALLIFFNTELFVLAKALFVKGPKTHLAWFLAIATVPAVIAGVLLESMAESSFRSPRLVAITFILAALIMLWAERHMQKRKTHTKLNDVTLKQSLVIGAAQAAALVPGVSRSGSTITTGLFMGMDRIAATKFSFLLGIPITAGAIAKVLLSEQAFSTINGEFAVFAAGTITAFVSGIIAIRFLLRFLANHSLDVFAYYRIVLGVSILLLMTVR